MSEKIRVKLKPDSNIVRLPAIALRGLVVFPSNVIHFEVGRKKSIAAIEWAMANNNSVFLVTQRSMDVEDPQMADLYSYGVVAEIKQLLRISDDLVKVIVEGKYRAKLITLEEDENFLLSGTKSAPVRGISKADEEKAEALIRTIKESFEEYVALNPRLPKDVIYGVLTNEDAAKLSEFIPANLMFKYNEKQEILNISSVIKRLERILELLQRENRVLGIEKDIQGKVAEQMEKNQRDYYLREQMRAISDELDEGEDTRSEAEAYKEKINALKNLPKEGKEKLLKETDRLFKMPGGSQETSVIRTYLDTCLDVPWDTATKDILDVKKVEDILEKEHYGLSDVKDKILEQLSVLQLTPKAKGQIICLVGPPGVGKTSIARSIAESMDKNYVRISLGGVRDEAEIRGHRRTYIGAMPGKIMSGVISAKSNNALILLDEIDKMASDFRGDPAAALLEVLDPEQNKAFNDHYIDIPFDLSNTLFITTANSLDTIQRPLLDRMDIIQIPSYTREDKFQIAKNHLWPKQLERNGLEGKVKISDAAIYAVIDGYTQEAGVRHLERTLVELLRKCAKKIVSGEKEKVSIGIQDVGKLLGPVRVKPSFYNKTNAVGIANGLAWTSIGGEVLPIEVELVPGGSGRLELTGSLGDVMKESAKLAITYAKVVADKFGYGTDVFKNTDIHIHAPEGAVPKDGPSAGITLATALISKLSGKPVRSDIAMTGEITLHGNVLPIGGLPEKSMAAYQHGMKIVLIPKENEADLYKVNALVKKNVKFIPVSNLEEAFKISLLDVDDDTNKTTAKIPPINKKEEAKQEIRQ